MKKLIKSVQDFFIKADPSALLLKVEYNDEVMTFIYDDGTTLEYTGSCTVWHRLPYMQRCSTLLEADLSEIWTYINRHGNPYPLAHESNLIKK